MLRYFKYLKSSLTKYFYGIVNNFISILYKISKQFQNEITVYLGFEIFQKYLSISKMTQKYLQ